jgi:hypothetical protein
MGYHINRPTVADGLVTLGVADFYGVAAIVYAKGGILIRQGLASFSLDNRQLTDGVITVRQIDLV